jgi:hypothetical protein
MATDPKSSEGRAYGYRRGGKKETQQNSPPPLPGGPGSSNEGGIMHVCKRFECRKQDPFELKGSALDEPLCPSCNKGDKLEEQFPEELPPARRLGLGKAAALIGVAVFVCSAGWWWLNRSDPDPKPIDNATVIMGVPESLSFGEVALSESKEQTLPIGNGGNVPLEITRIEISPEESFGLDQSSVTVAPESNTELKIEFHPVTEALCEGELRLVTNDPMAPTLLVKLTGTGTKRKMGEERSPWWVLDELDKTSKILKEP